MIERNVIHHGDALSELRKLPDGVVQCCITSPPYWGLRDYGNATWEGGDSGCDHATSRGGPRPELPNPPAGWAERDATPAPDKCKCGAIRHDPGIGLESTFDEWLAKMVLVMREVRRVLRDDGTLWLNMGDSYSGGGNNSGNTQEISDKQGSNRGNRYEKKIVPPGMKPKDLIGQPWRLAFALQADGAASPETMRVVGGIRDALMESYDTWDAVPDRVRSEIERLDREWADAHEGAWWLRSDIIWHKPNPMPESVTDRPTKSHEYIFLMTKRARYYYNADAVREPQVAPWRNGEKNDSWGSHLGGHDTVAVKGQVREYNPLGRNKRTVWTIPTAPFLDAHFATFPTKLVSPCVLAGTPPKCCGVCGMPWETVAGKTDIPSASHKGSSFDTGKTGARDGGERTQSGERYENAVTGYRSACDHVDGSGRSIVLDPFIGSGTVALVAKELNRDYIGIELNAEYIKMAEKRLCQGVLELT